MEVEKERKGRKRKDGGAEALKWVRAASCARSRRLVRKNARSASLVCADLAGLGGRARGGGGARVSERGAGAR